MLPLAVRPVPELSNEIELLGWIELHDVDSGQRVGHGSFAGREITFDRGRSARVRRSAIRNRGRR
jgi:hypothetical protein